MTDRNGRHPAGQGEAAQRRSLGRIELFQVPGNHRPASLLGNHIKQRGTFERIDLRLKHFDTFCNAPDIARKHLIFMMFPIDGLQSDSTA